MLPVPVLRSEPGVGFNTGVRGRYVYREPEDTKNRVQLDVVARISLKGVHQHEMQLGLRDLFGKNEVIRAGFKFDYDDAFTFVGLANRGYLPISEVTTARFEVARLSAATDVNYQFVLKEFPSRAKSDSPSFLRGFVGWNFGYDRLRAEPGTVLANERPQDEGANTRGTFYAGVAWDSRDNDWNPKDGSLHDVSVGFGGPWAGGETMWQRANVSFRHYHSLGTPKLVLAHQVLGEHVFGDAPLIPLSEFSGIRLRSGVGGLETGRGYSRGRFIGERKVYSSLELRIEPHEFFLGRFSLVPGIKPFVDGGWVQSTSKPSDGVAFMSGGVGIYAVWDKFEVLRLDAGFSPEGFALVMSADHAF